MAGSLLVRIQEQLITTLSSGIVQALFSVCLSFSGDCILQGYSLLSSNSNYTITKVTDPIFSIILSVGS